MPQRVWLRRAAFQIHLWIGVAIGLYVVVLSITGSVLVYRNELDQLFATPRPQFDPDAPRLTTDQLRAAAEKAYPGYTITYVSDRISRRSPVISVTAERGSEKKDRLFDPYTGADLGDSITQGELSVLWLVRLHDELLLGREGQWWNGLGSLVFTLLVLTGAVVWWPGVTRWKRSLAVKVRGGWRRFNWDLHSALGFWLFLFMLMWGISGFYLGMPQPLTDLIDRFADPDAIPGERTGDLFLSWLTRLHFGRWRTPGWGQWLKAVWALIGLVPAIMFVTGIVMWWNRVVRKRAVRNVPDFAEALTAPTRRASAAS
jgi:uncharacterized iron-regulated membrane protein